ncbi:unnamed protein product [Moneuplotes crassus]|uniref:Uncharacterized protein n=1 Tax=Euplotes crassus TaxID=5936 RepID=A0AAD1Y4M2_EUPCR|nr:unnamed protein product [Moneuplotes crassus]
METFSILFQWNNLRRSLMRQELLCLSLRLARAQCDLKSES